MIRSIRATPLILGALAAAVALSPTAARSQAQERPAPAPAVSIAPVIGTSPTPLSIPSSTPAPAETLPQGVFLAAPPSKPLDMNSLKTFTGQLLDARGGYVYFTTGDAFKLAATARIVDYTSGEATTITPDVKMFAKATLDPKTKQIIVLAITRRRLPTDAQFATLQQYAVPTSPKQPAPELAGQIRLTGKPVAVTFFVEVPPTTPLTDSVYIATDASGWQANAYRMDRVDAIHYRLSRNFASGTKFAYKYTRGSWNSVELGKTGLQPDAHNFFVRESDARVVQDTVYGWSDQQANNLTAGPNAVPQIFNPLGTTGFPPGTGGLPQPDKTPPNGLPPGCTNPPSCKPTKRP